MSREIPFGVSLEEMPDYDLGGLRNRIARNPLDPLFEKRWSFLGVVHPEIFLGLAVIRVGLLGSAFAYVHDRVGGRMFTHNMMGAPFQARVDPDPLQGWATFRAARGGIALGPRGSDGYRYCQAILTFPGSSIEVHLRVGWSDWTEEALCLMAPMPRSRFAFTRKLAGVPVTGSIKFPGRRLVLKPDTAYAIHDFTLGFHPHRTFWNWAAAAGRDQDGHVVAFNLSKGVYEGDSGENVVWVDGRPHLLGAVEFTYESSRPKETWRISAPDGGIDLRFTPEGMRKANLNLILVASRFVQLTGTFSGRLVAGDQTVAVEGIGGFVEEHFAKW